MSTLCDSMLNQDIMANCEDVGDAGFRKRAWLFNSEDVNSIIIMDNDVRYFTLKSGARGYIVEQLGRKPFEGTNSALVVGTYRNSFTHQVKFFIPDNKSVGSLVDQIATGKFIIFMNNGNGGIRVYGAHNGLTAVECTQTPYNEEYDSGWVVTLEETKSQTSRLVYGKANTQDKNEENLNKLCGVVV